MEKLALTTNDILSTGRTLNFESIVNFEKAINQNDFRSKYCNEGHEVFSAESVVKFVNEGLKKINSIEKAEGGVDKDELIKGLTDQVNQLTKVVVDVNGDNKYFYVRKKEVIEKAEIEVLYSKGAYEAEKDSLEKAEGTSFSDVNVEGETLKAIIKGEADNTIEKALDSFKYASNIQFKKTGTEIKEHLEKIEDKVEDKKLLIKQQMDDLLDKIDQKPTEKLSEWDTKGLSSLEDLRKFNWNLCYYNADKQGGMSEYSVASKSTVVAPASKEEAENCSKYNDLCYKYCNLVNDLKTIKVYKENLEDKTTYTLTLDQVKELGF